MNDVDKQVRAYYTVEQLNGFGFNTFSDYGLILGILREQERPEHFIGDGNAADDAEMQRRSGAPTARFSSSYGGDTLEVGWRDHRKAADCVNACIAMGVGIQLQNTLQQTFVGGGEAFSVEADERKFLASFDTTMALFAASRPPSTSAPRDENAAFGWALMSYPTASLACPWNWQTERGRAFARRVGEWRRRKGGDDAEPLSARYKMAHYTCFEQRHNTVRRYFPTDDDPPVPEPCDPPCGVVARGTFTQISFAATVAKRRAADDDDDDDDDRETCMICLTNKANTLVLPCGDSVVCSECSPRLRDTPDRRTCCKCRRPVTEVLYDDAVE